MNDGTRASAVPGEARMTAQPRILCDPSAIATASDPQATGAIWRLEPHDRDLDANVIQLPPGASIHRHDGPAIDVLVHVLRGSGQLGTTAEVLALEVGALVWLPRHSPRQFTAGPEGLAYLTVHQRRRPPELSIGRRL